MYGQLSVVHAIPLYAYVGVELTDGKKFEFEVRGINKKANTVRLEELTAEQVEPILQWHEEERIKKYLEFWRVKNKQNYFKLKVWFEVPPKCGLNSSGAIGAALAGLLQILEAGENKYEALVEKINAWKHKSVEEIKADPIFRDVFLKAWILDDCSHGFSSSGNGPFCSLVGSPDGNLLLYFTQKKGFDSQHPIKRITKSDEELTFNDFEEVGRKIAQIDWWGKKLTLKKDLKDLLGTALIYCGTPKDTGDILAELNKKYNIPIEDFKSFFSSMFPKEKLKEFAGMARPISDFIKDYPESPLGTEFYTKSLFCESLGLLSWMLVRFVTLCQDPKQLYAHIESINKLLDFYGVFGEQQTRLYKQIKEINPNVGVKMTGAGGGGDLVVFGNRDSIEGIENHIKEAYAVHFSTNHMGWEADGLTVVPAAEERETVLKGDMLEIGIRGTKPYILVNGTAPRGEIQEHIFVPILYLAAARCRDKVVSKVEDLLLPAQLKRKEQLLTDIRDFFSTMLFKQDIDRRDLLPSDKKGNVCLEAFDGKSIVIDRSICFFESQHMRQAERIARDLLESPDSGSDPRSQKAAEIQRENLRNRLEQECKLTFRHTRMVMRVAEIMGWEFQNTDWWKRWKRLVEVSRRIFVSSDYDEEFLREQLYFPQRCFQ
jgi:mevalonate kinase